MRRPRTRRARRGGAATTLIVMLVVVALIVLVVLLVSRLERRDVTLSRGGGTAASSPGGAATAGGTATGSGQATSASPGDFNGCPAEGDGGDRALNRLKNRAPPTALRDTPFDSVLLLPVPQDNHGGYRARWPKAATASVAPIERRAVRVEGYVARASLSGPESTNCHGDAASDRDYHIWLTALPTTTRTGSVIVEMTPRMRAVHAGWDLPRLRDVSRRKERVRVGGWLLLDQEHPEQVGRTRGTIWEIHPVTSFEVHRGGRWIALDDLPLPRGRR